MCTRKVNKFKCKACRDIMEDKTDIMENECWELTKVNWARDEEKKERLLFGSCEGGVKETVQVYQGYVECQPCLDADPIMPKWVVGGKLTTT